MELGVCHDHGAPRNSSVEVQAKRRDGLAEYQSGRTAEDCRESTQHLQSEEVQAKKQNTFDAKWTAKFNKLAAFHAVNGNLNVPNGHELYDWISTQRLAKNNPKRTNKLNNERIALLDGLGFEWNLQNANWTAKFNKLAAFQAANEPKRPEGSQII